jgi:hypothetical protein
MLICLFCFFVYILNLVLKIIEIVDTYHVSTHICFQFFWNLEIGISEFGIMVSYEVWDLVIFSPKQATWHAPMAEAKAQRKAEDEREWEDRKSDKALIISLDRKSVVAHKRNARSGLRQGRDGPGTSDHAASQ